MKRRFDFDGAGDTADIPGWGDAPDGVADRYTINGLVAHGDICEVYSAKNADDDMCVLKVCRSHDNNDLLENEFKVTSAFRKSPHWKPPITPSAEVKLPLPVESFLLDDGKKPRRVNVFSCKPKASKPPLVNPVTLTEVHIAYPVLDVRDAAWMFNRTLDALHCLHTVGYVHGAVTPDHVLVEPENHRGQLLDFCYAAKEGELVSVMTPQWREFYAPEILRRMPVTFATDIYMAARCLFYLVGMTPDVANDDVMPKPIYQLLRACLLGQASRVQTAAQVHHDFRDILTQLYGKRTFRPFAMPVPISDQQPLTT